MRLRLCLTLLLLGLVAPAWAQTGASPETLDLAKQLVAETGGNRDDILAAMTTPMVGMMQQMGVSDPAKAKVLVTEAVMPILHDNFDTLLTMQAQSIAQVLSPDDLRAVIAFYKTKAGQDLIKAQPAMAQARVQKLTEWMQTLQPQMQAKIQQIAAAHGWDKPGAK